MDLRRSHVIQKHQRNNRLWAIFCDFACLLERDFLGGHAAQVDKLGEPKRTRLVAEAGQAVNAVVAVAAVPIRGRVI